MWRKIIDRVKSTMGLHHAVPTEGDVAPDRGTVVSRVSGDDAGTVGESGAEARNRPD